MDVEILGDLMDWLDALERFERHSGLEFWFVSSSFCFHLVCVRFGLQPAPTHHNHSLAPGPNFGAPLNPHGENIHCWIHVDGWHIDFMAPLFPEVASLGNMPPCNRMQFCKPISLGKDHPNDLLQAGDFFALPDKERTLSVVDELAKKPANADLMSICCAWFRKPPVKMLESILIGKGNQGPSRVHFSRIQITGSW